VTWSGVCAAKEKQAVTISYVLAPARPLPEGLKAVAVIDSGVETKGARQDEREQKWSTMAADLIESMLANSAARFGSGLKVAQRRQTAAILKEQDLKLAGLVEGDAAAKAGKLLDVQGLITSRITVNIDVQKGTKSTLDWGRILGGLTQPQPQPAPRQPRAYPGSAAPGERPVYPGSTEPGKTPDPKDTRQKRTPSSPRDTRNSDPNAVQQRRYVPDPRYARDPRYVRDPRYLRYRRYYYYDSRYQPTAPPGVVVVPAPAPGPGPQPLPVEPPPQEGGPFGTREVEEISRHITVQCTFSLIDAVTGAAIAHFSPPPYQKQDTASPNFLFGSIADEAKLDPIDHFIGELVERAAQEFVSMIVPTEVEYSYVVVGRGKEGERGIRALRADDYPGAMELFLAARRKDPDEHETVFALGVVSELLADPQRALEYYRQACAMDADKEELQQYVAAKKRLNEHIARIMKPQAAEKANPPPGEEKPTEAKPGEPIEK